MLPNPQEIEEILNGKLHFCAVRLGGMLSCHVIQKKYVNSFKSMFQFVIFNL